MPAQEAVRVDGVGKVRLMVQIKRSRLELQVLQKIEVFSKKLEAGSITDVNTKTVSVQRVNGITYADRRMSQDIGGGGERDIYVLSDDVAITDTFELCVWRHNMYGTGWCVIPPRHISATSLNELELFMQAKI